MTWTAPEVERVAAPYAADERAMLQGLLDEQRRTLLAKCAGLGRDDLVRRSVPPSTLTLLGLVRHLADVERWWLRTNVCGAGLQGRFGPDDNLEGDFVDVDTADPAADLAAWAEEVALADAAVADLPVDHTFWNERRQASLSLRWVYLHLIAEYARHNGHADLLRERIDGRTGE